MFTSLIFLAVAVIGADESTLFQKYEALHASTLQRLVVLENKIDGISEEVRTLLKDRKRAYAVEFKDKGKLLADPVLTNAIITERKRLEKEETFLQDLRKSPVLAKQMERKLASNLLALEATNVLLTFTEFLDEYNRGIKAFPGPKDLEVMKVLAGTHTALSYPKKIKEQMALADPAILKLSQSETESTLKIIESGLGKMNEDTLFPIPAGTSKKEQSKLDIQRLKKTKQLIKMVEQLSTIISVANKSLSDEYQLHVLLLNQKLKEQRELSNTRSKP